MVHEGSTVLFGKELPDRFGLITRMVDVWAHVAMLPLDDEEDVYSEISDLWWQVWHIGAEWARVDPLALRPVVPAILADLRDVSGHYGSGFSDAFRGGYNSANSAACVFPKPRERDERPAIVLFENPHFYVSPCERGLQIVSKNLGGAFGAVSLTPGVANRAFDAAEHNKPMSEAYWYNADPYGMDAPSVTLLRDDLKAGWEGTEGDDWNTPYPRYDSDTIGELFLKVEHPGDGDLYFGAVMQESQQLSAFVSLRAEVLRLFEEAQSPARRVEARERATKISRLAGYSFMPHTGFCFSCEADITPLLIDGPPGRSITGCPACGRTWCD